MTYKICFFGDAQSEHTQRWVSAMAERGFDCSIITNRPASILHTKVVCLSNYSGRKLSWLYRVYNIRKIVRKLDPDIIHGHYITSYGFWAAACGITPLVLTAWGSDILVTPQKNILMKLLTSWTLKRADFITADARNILEEIETYGIKAKLEQVQWGIDISCYVESERLASKPLEIISLRSWEPNYRIDTIIIAYANLLLRQPDISLHLHLLGGGSQEQELKNMVKQYGIQEHITFHGRLPENDVINLLKQSDISISVPQSDGTAVSVLESMAAGLPLVVSDLPANREWISDDGGIIVPCNDVDAISYALKELVMNETTRINMGERNRKKVFREANRKTEMDRMAVFYHQLLEKN